MLLVVRPLVAGLALRGSCGSASERAAMAFFGVRGIGSIYYVAYALGAATFADSDRLWGVVGLVVASSVVLHGTTAGPVMAVLDRRKDAARAGSPRGRLTPVAARAADHSRTPLPLEHPVTLSRTWSDRPLATKVSAVVVCAAAGLAASAAVSVSALGDVEARTADLQRLNGLTRVTLEADMGHDAVRADVLQALTFPSGPQHDEAEDGMDEHGAALRDGVATVRAAALGAAGRARAPRPPPRPWTATSRPRTRLLEQDAAAARAGYPAFLDSFSEVEDALPLVSDAVDAQVALAATAVSDARDAAQRRLLLVGLLVLALVVAVGRLVVRGVVGPLRRVGGSLAAMAQGDLTQDPGVDGQDEVGRLARSLAEAQAGVRDTVQALARTAASLAASGQALAASATGAAAASAQVEVQADAVSGAAEQVSRNVESAAAGADQMGASIREISQSASDAAGVAADAVRVARDTTRTVPT